MPWWNLIIVLFLFVLILRNRSRSLLFTFNHNFTKNLACLLVFLHNLLGSRWFYIEFMCCISNCISFLFDKPYQSLSSLNDMGRYLDWYFGVLSTFIHLRHLFELFNDYIPWKYIVPLISDRSPKRNIFFQQPKQSTTAI